MIFGKASSKPGALGITSRGKKRYVITLENNSQPFRAQEATSTAAESDDVSR
jgi:hypothetical protein